MQSVAIANFIEKYAWGCRISTLGPGKPAWAEGVAGPGLVWQGAGRISDSVTECSRGRADHFDVGAVIFGLS